MGKPLISTTSEQSNFQIHEKVNQGCGWGMFHYWGVKKVFHHKKKRHSKYKRTIILQDQQNVVTKSESLLITKHGEILNAKEKHSPKNHMNKQKKDGNATDQSSLNKDISIKFKNTNNVLEMISVEKNAFLKFLRDIDIGSKKIHQASHKQAILAKSESFPLAVSPKTKNINSSTLRAKQRKICDFLTGYNGAGAIKEYKKSKSLSDTKAFESNSNKRDDRLVRRTSSLDESMDRYTQLFEKSLSNEVKWQMSKSKSLKLTNEDKIHHKSRHGPMFLRRSLSMPNLESLGFILHDVLLHTNDEGNNNTVESYNDFQNKSLEHLTEIDETVEGSDKDYVNPSSLCKKMVEKIDEDVTTDQREVTSSSTFDPVVISNIEERVPKCQENTISIAEGKESNTRGTGSDASVKAETDANKSLENHFLHFKSYSKNNPNIKYVKEVLEFSGFIGNEQNKLRYTVDQPIKPSIFITLEASLLHENEYSKEENINIYDHQLLFNLVNEVLSQIYDKSPTYFPRPFSFNYLLKPMPKGNYLLNEVCDSVNSYLSLRPKFDKTLDDVIGRDLMKSGWMNLQQEEECVALELEEMVMDDLLDELIFE